VAGPYKYGIESTPGDPSATWDTTGVEPGNYTVSVTIKREDSDDLTGSEDVVVDLRPISCGDVLPVALRRTATAPTPDLALWTIIRKSTEALSFQNYSNFMDIVLCGVTPPAGTDPRGDVKSLQRRRSLPYTDADAYRLLKVSTEAFLMVNCGVDFTQPNFIPDDLLELTQRVSTDIRGLDLDRLWNNYLKTVNGGPDLTVPYLELVRRNLSDSPLNDFIFSRDPTDTVEARLSRECYGILRTKLTQPCLLELIWNYWHEEGMLVQTMRAISRRFQNVRAPREPDPLALVEIDPLRPLNNLIWGYIQDEQHRLSITRRAYEYLHHYGLDLQGQAVPTLRGADNRSKFIEAFHNLLYLCSIFFKEDDDTTVVADGFPILNALKDVHLLLSEGAHNQFGDLPSTSRIEMLMEQWLLARPEFTQFLPTRVMVAYPAAWMNRVDAMKTVQRWSDVSVLHFANLGDFGERILLSTRYGAWSTVNNPVQAANWARFWRAEIQGYTHAYRAVTGVDITEYPDVSLPSVLLRQRLPGRAPMPIPAGSRPALRAAEPVTQARPAVPARMPSELPGWGELNL
jgi:hypothetical protein